MCRLISLHSKNKALNFLNGSMFLIIRDEKHITGSFHMLHLLFNGS